MSSRVIYEKWNHKLHKNIEYYIYIIIIIALYIYAYTIFKLKYEKVYDKLCIYIAFRLNINNTNLEQQITFKNH